MSKQSIDGDSIIGFAIFMCIVGIACAAYAYAPFYGATPLAIGASILLLHGIDAVIARRKGKRR